MIDKLLVQEKHNHKYGADHPQYIFPAHDDDDQQLLSKCSPSASSTPASPQYPPLKDDTHYGIGPLSSMVMSTTPHSDVSSGVLLTPKEEFMPLRADCHSRSSVQSSQSHDYSPRSTDFSPRSHDFSQDMQYNQQVDKLLIQKGCGAYNSASFHNRDDHMSYNQGLSTGERKRHLMAQREVLMMEQRRLRMMLMEQEALLRSKQDQLQRQQNLQRQRLSFFQQIGYLPPTSLPSVPDEYPPEGHSTPQSGGHDQGYNTPCPDTQSLYSMATTLPSYSMAGSSHHMANGLSPSQTLAGSPSSSHSGLHASGVHPTSPVHALQAGVSSHSMSDSPSVHNHHNGVVSSHSPSSAHPSSHTVTDLHPPLHNSLYMNNNIGYNEPMTSSVHHMGYMTPSNTRHHPYSMASQPHRQYYPHGMDGAHMGGNYMMQQHMLEGGEHGYGHNMHLHASHGHYPTHTINSNLPPHTNLENASYHGQHLAQQLPLQRKPHSKGMDTPELGSSATSPLQSTTSTLNSRLSDAQTSFSNHVDGSATTTTTATSATAVTQHTEAFNSTHRSDTETGYRCKQETRLTDAGGGSSGDGGEQICGTNFNRSEMLPSGAQHHTDAYLLDIVGEVENEHNSDSGYHGYMSLQAPGSMAGYHSTAAAEYGNMHSTMSPHMAEMEESRVLDQVFFVK